MRTQQLTILEDVSHEGSTFQDILEKFGLINKAGWPDDFGRNLRKWSNSTNKTSIRTLSLFSGAGGLDIGFRDAGFNVVSAVEIEEKFVATLQENFSDENIDINCIDIRDFDPGNLGEIDFIIGGPPCQTFSAAGRRAAGVLGTTDERGTLFEEYVRILKVLKPKGFLFENVYGLTGAENGEAWNEIRKAFADAGYRIYFRVLDAADYGVPQFRERLIIVGTQDREYLFPKPTHGPDSPDNHPYYSAGRAINECLFEGEDLHRTVGGRYGHLLNDIPPGLNYSFYTEKMGHPQPVFAWRSKFSDFLYKADPDVPVRTLKAQGGQYTGPFHWDNRPFSISELKRLQTFPDDYSLVGGRQTIIHQIGNSVPPQLARMLAVSILHQLFDVEIPFNLPVLGHNDTLGFRQRKRKLTKIYAEKAKNHISQIKNIMQQPTGFTNRKYRATLSTKFDWKELNSGQFGVNVEVIGNALEINVGHSQNKALSEFEIFVEPVSKKPWILNVEKVILRGEKLEPFCYTAVWKAFECELARSGYKSDIVQLCGYYQYESTIKSTINFNVDSIDVRWEVVREIVSGKGVGALYSTEELGKLLGKTNSIVPSVAKFLRELGYEVRNHNTNPQIPKEHYLIPYHFPTLTPLSVQLNKSLG